MVPLQKIWLFAKSQKTITIREVNRFLREKMTHKGENYSVKLHTYFFCNGTFRSANKTLKGIEAMNMIKKGQVNDLNYSVLNEVKYINQLFGVIL